MIVQPLAVYALKIKFTSQTPVPLIDKAMNRKKAKPTVCHTYLFTVVLV